MKTCISVVIGCVVLIAILPLYSQPADAFWPMFGYDASRAGRSPDYRGCRNGKLLWSYRTGNEVDSSPAIGPNGRVFAGSMDNRVYAVTAKGALAWSYDTGNIVYSSPAVDSSGRVFILALNGGLYSFTSGGGISWSYAVGVDSQSTSPALVSAGRVYVKANAMSIDENLYCFGSAGTFIWSYSVSDAYASPSVDSVGRVLVGSSGSYHGLIAVDSGGSLSWSFPTNDGVHTTAAIGTDGSVYFGSSDYSFYALSSNGSFRWSYEMQYHIHSSPAISSDGRIYVGTLNPDNSIFSLTSDGALSWSYLTGASVHSSPALDKDDMVYIGSSDWTFQALTSKGSLSWSYWTNGGVMSSVAIGNVAAAFGTRNGDNTIYFFQDPTPTPTATPTSTPIPQAEIELNGSSFSLGDSFAATFVLNKSIQRPFTAFAVIIMPSGAMLNALTLDTPLKPVASNVPGLNAPFQYPLLTTTIPAGAPKGSYEIVAAFFDPAKPITGRGDAFLEASSTFTIE